MYSELFELEKKKKKKKLEIKTKKKKIVTLNEASTSDIALRPWLSVIEHFWQAINVWLFQLNSREKKFTVASCVPKYMYIITMERDSLE